jgi:hypothetical protein
VEVREIDAEHFPMALALSEVAVQYHVLFTAVRSSLPCSYGGPHRMYVGDNEPASRLQNSERLAGVRNEIGQITLIQIRRDEMEALIRKKREILHVGGMVFFARALDTSRGCDHGLAEVHADHAIGAVRHEHAAKTSFSAPAIENRETLDIAASAEHRFVQQTRTRSIATFACFLDPGSREPHPLSLQFAHFERVLKASLRIHTSLISGRTLLCPFRTGLK